MRIIHFLSRILNIFASAVLVAMMLLTVADVCLRYFLNYPILGATELTENMMVCMAFFALAWCAGQQGHLRVDLVVSRFSPKMQAVFDSITSLVGLIVVALIAWRSFVEGSAVRELNIISSLLKLPAFPFYYVVAAGSALLCLVMVTQVVQHIHKAVNG